MMSPRQVSLTVLAAATVGLFVFAPDVILVVFAGVLLAVLFDGGGSWTGKRTGLSRNWGIALFSLAIVVAIALAALIFAPSVAEQVDELVRDLPQAFDELRRRLERYSWAERILGQATPENIAAGEGRDAAAWALSSTLGLLSNAVIILFIGLYGAIEPDLYRKGLRAVLAPSIRERGEEVMRECARTLRNWLGAQLLSMAVVGVLTTVGLSIIGIPLAFILGLIAALLAFIPNVGPVLAAAPALLLAFPDGWSSMLWVVAVYLGVQTIESYFITPMIMKERANLAPAYIIATQVLFGSLFGLLGLALATPLAALGLTLAREVYVRDYLDKELGGGSRLASGES